MNKNRQVRHIEGYLKEVSEIKAECPRSTLVFRGQENEDWLLESSAERRLKENLPSQKEIANRLFIEYHEDLLKKCRLKNYDRREQKQLDDLELLADLQHHGAATCLMDFTRNALVALWFACKKSDANGKVFVVDIADQRTFLEITHTDIEDKSISDILQSNTRNTDKGLGTELSTPETSVTLLNKPSFWYWKPAHLNERITAQHSLLLFGLPASEELRSAEITIDSASKEQILKELEELHDICEESLFPDFVGFAYIQRVDAPYLAFGAEEYFRSGIKAGQQGQYSEAIEDYTKAIQLDSDDPEKYDLRGRAYLDKGNYDQAIQDLTNAILRDPEFADTYFFRGNAYLSNGDYDEAIKDFSDAIRLEPDEANYLARSFSYYKRGKLKCTIQDATEAIRLNPDSAEAYYQRGLAYYGKEDYEQTLQDTNHAIQLKPDFVEAYLYRGLAYYNKEDYDHTLQDTADVIQLKPDCAEAYGIHGLAYRGKGEYEKAIQNFTKSIELNPKLYKTYYFRGLAFLHLRKWKEAKSDLTAAKNMGLDIVASFQSDYKSIADFEQKTGISLPEEIGLMLTEKGYS